MINAFELASISTHPLLIEAHKAIVTISESSNNSEAATKHVLAIGKISENDEGDVFPKNLFSSQPFYPKELAKEAKQGETLLSFIVDKEGFVKDIEVEKSSHRLFSRASKRALKRWRFAPNFMNGEAITGERQSVIGNVHF